MCDERFWRGRPQSHSNSFKYLNQKCSSTTARIKDDYTWVCEARGNTKVLTKRIVDPRNHIFDDLWRRIPYRFRSTSVWETPGERACRDVAGTPRGTSASNGLRKTLPQRRTEGE